MSTSPPCPKCGFANSTVSQFCSNCGSPLTSTAKPSTQVPLQIPVYPGQYPTRPLDHALARMSPEQRKRISRTRTGIFLVLLGIIFGPIPATAYIASIVLIVGAVMIFLGRRAFGQEHQRNVAWSIAALILGVLTGFVLGLWFAFSVFLAARASATPNDMALTLSSSYSIVLIGFTAADAVIGIALVLFTYQIQTPTSRPLLWAAYSLTLAVDFIVFAIVSPQLLAVSQNIVSQLGPGGDLAEALQYQFSYLRLLEFIPAIPYSFAYILGWKHVEEESVIETTSSQQQLRE